MVSVAPGSSLMSDCPPERVADCRARSGACQENRQVRQHVDHVPSLCCRPFDLHAHVQASARGEHGKGVKAEVVDASAQEIVESWLCDLEPARGCCLGGCPFRDRLPDGEHEFGPQAHVGGFGGAVLKGIPHTREHLAWYVPSFCHGLLLVSSFNRASARSRSRLDVACVFFWKACST